MKNYKVLLALLIAAFAGLALFSGFCLAANNHSCCPKVKTECPMQSLQKASPSVEAKGIKIKNPPTRPAPGHKHESNLFLPLRQEFVSSDTSLPNLFLSAKISHQTTAPPQA